MQRLLLQLTHSCTLGSISGYFMRSNAGPGPASRDERAKRPLGSLGHAPRNPLHFLARCAVCSQMSCTACKSNNNIQTPEHIRAPCTMPYFHKGTLTPLSSSRSPPLEGGGPSTYAARKCRDASLYNAFPLLRDLHPAP